MASQQPAAKWSEYNVSTQCTYSTIAYSHSKVVLYALRCEAPFLFGNAACATAGCRRGILVASYVQQLATGTNTSNRSRYLWLHGLPAHGVEHFDSHEVWVAPVVEFFPEVVEFERWDSRIPPNDPVRAFFAATGTVKADR